ncbi:hypothetical protein CSA56_05520 [candidate division KSB3 bacterium]|uniref:Heavy-metal chelation domain-containing protein n=1 Tax=candidate division KSB3 bacterium TaxID=2044937 RepID=A0A2G6KHF5_9BACT|nr:MAG: hypothetical protein CSA56_05520 [candidate division KSB3 bacterium]
MATIDKLIDYALSENGGEQIADLRIGLGYTAVLLTSGACGLACMLRHRLIQQHSCSLLAHAGTFVGTHVADVIPLLRSTSVVEASVGLAAINALTANQDHPSSDENLFDLLQLRSSDVVGIVGYIGPIVNEARRRAREVMVFDEVRTDMSDVYDTSREQELLPECDMTIISATSLLNHTFDDLVAMSSSARSMCLMGPSTPLLPGIFQSKGITVLAGRQIQDSKKVLQIVSEAGGTKRFGEAARKINLLLKQT